MRMQNCRKKSENLELEGVVIVCLRFGHENVLKNETHALFFGIR